MNNPARVELTIDRVIVTASGPVLHAAGLDALIRAEVSAALAGVALPTGRTVKAGVGVSAPALDSAASIARAVGSGVSQAVSQGRAHG
jgi:hypothetical protein